MKFFIVFRQRFQRLKFKFAANKHYQHLRILKLHSSQINISSQAIPQYENI